MVKCHTVPIIKLEIFPPYFTALNPQNNLICLIVYNHKWHKRKLIAIFKYRKAVKNESDFSCFKSNLAHKSKKNFLRQRFHSFLRPHC